MKNYLLMLFTILFVNGCSYVDRTVAHYTGFSKICIDKVEYIQFTSGASVEYNTNGKVVTCNNG